MLKRAPGIDNNFCRNSFSTNTCDRCRSLRGTSLIDNVALRRSAGPIGPPPRLIPAKPPPTPIDVKTFEISGIVRVIASTSSTVRCVSSSVLPGASYGNVQVITDPDLGISVMLVQYVDHKKGTATQRIALMYGTAAGQGNAGQLLKAASGTGTGR